MDRYAGMEVTVSTSALDTGSDAVLVRTRRLGFSSLFIRVIRVIRG